VLRRDMEAEPSIVPILLREPIFERDTGGRGGRAFKEFCLILEFCLVTDILDLSKSSFKGVGDLGVMP
jgi:hypothetical protein